MFLTSKQTGGPLIFALRDSNCYLAMELLQEFDYERPRGTTARIGITERLIWQVREFDIEQLAEALGQPASETWQGHAQVILLACTGGKLFEWLNSGGE